MSTDANSFVLTAAQSGAAATGAVGTFVAPFDLQIVAVTASSATDATANVVADVNVAGTSLFADANRPTIATGTATASTQPDSRVTRTRDGYADDFISGGVVTTGERFTTDIDTAGTGATDVVLALHCVKL